MSWESFCFNIVRARINWEPVKTQPLAQQAWARAWASVTGSQVLPLLLVQGPPVEW